MSDETDNPGSSEPGLHVHIPQDLEYVYRDVVNIHVGSAEVILEFGNRHRSPPGHACLSNRIVLSIENAYAMKLELEQALVQAREQLMQAHQKATGK